jgi:hypothetical protein
MTEVGRCADTVLEEGRRRREIEFRSCVDTCRHQLVSLEIIELAAVSRPRGLNAATRRNANRVLRSPERLHPYFK